MKRQAAWVRWHSPELVLTTLPTVAAVTLHPAWLALTAVVAGGWALQEFRVPRPDPSPPPDGGRRAARDDQDERDEVSA